jgi:predicted nucleic acid-binding protein
MRHGEMVFVDSGAWIALALTQDPNHEQARDLWEKLMGLGARLCASIPVVLETFTFLDRNTERDVALAWRAGIDGLDRFQVLECTLVDLRASWAYFARRDLHRLSAVDATSFTIMRRKKIRTAFAFDHHFAVAGFRLVG